MIYLNDKVFTQITESERQIKQKAGKLNKQRNTNTYWDLGFQQTIWYEGLEKVRGLHLNETYLIYPRYLTTRIYRAKTN